MKLITTNLLNRFWVNGIIPIIKRIESIEDKTASLDNSVTLRHYTGNITTITALIKGLTGCCLCLTTTEYISDKPANKYGTIMVVKLTDSRAYATCICTDGTYMVNSWNASTSVLTGWVEK